MRKISVKIGVTAAFALALVSFAGAHNDAWAAALVKCAMGDLIADAIAGGATEITIKGTCTEIVTVTTDGITFSGHPGIGGTLIGGFIVDGVQRVVFDNMTVKDGTNGVLAQDGASVRVSNLTIENHTRDGVSIVRGSNALIEGSTIQNNGRYGVVVSGGSSARLRDNPLIQSNVFDSPRTLLDPFTGTALGVFHNSFVRLLGGNFILNDGGGIAVEAFHLADFRQQLSLDRIEGSPAISIGNGSIGELRGEYVVTGRVQVTRNSTLRLAKRFGPVGVINGQIRVFSDSSVFFSLFRLKGEIDPIGSVTVNGTLNCGGNEGHVRLFGGQVPEDIFPSQFDRENSQCNDYNGNVVLPVFGP